MAKNTYASKQLRWQKRLRELVPELQDRIALRNIDAAAQLLTQDQRILAEVIRCGFERKQPTAIRYLAAHPGALVEQVLAEAENFLRLETPAEAPTASTQLAASIPDCQTSSNDISALADLLQEFGLQKNRVVAETVAGADYMSGVLDVVLALDRVRKPPGAESETVTVALCAIAVRLVDQINTMLEQDHAHKMAVLQAEFLNWARYMAKK